MADQGKKKNKSKEEEVTPGVNPTPVYIGGESLADRILPHVKKILVGVIIFAVVVGAFFGYRAWTRSKAEKSTAAVIAALTEMRRDIEEEPDPEATDVTYASRQERAEAVLASLSKAKGDARNGVGLLEADMLLEAGRLDEAEAAYRRVAGRKDLEGVIAREGLGFVAEARPDLEKALEAFRAMQPDEAGPRRAYALYHEARVLAQLGKKDEARTQFEAALAKAKEGGDDTLEAFVDARLVQLDAPPIAGLGGTEPGGAAPPAPEPTAPTPTPETPPQ